MAGDEDGKEDLTRRAFLKDAAAAGAVMAAASGATDPAEADSSPPRRPTAPSLATLNTYGADLGRLLCLRTYPIAIKMLESESEVPEGVFRPKKDKGEHYAMCQAFALARRQGMTLAMFREDHWCFEPIISYGLVETPQDYLDGFTNSFFIADKDAARKHAQEMTRLPVGRYAGMVLGPLETARFTPDLAMVYCDTAQLRHLLLCLRYRNGTQVTSTIDPIGSCVHSVVPTLLNGQCHVTVPDPGDYERAGARDDEMILTVPTKSLKELMDGVYHFEERQMGFRRFSLAMRPDFPQPPFYQAYFRSWGLDAPGEPR